MLLEKVFAQQVPEINIAKPPICIDCNSPSFIEVFLPMIYLLIVIPLIIQIGITWFQKRKILFNLSDYLFWMIVILIIHEAAAYVIFGSFMIIPFVYMMVVR
jgi:hypothetical protein